MNDTHEQHIIVDSRQHDIKLLLRGMIFILSIIAGASCYYAATHFPRYENIGGDVVRENLITAQEFNEMAASLQAYNTPTYAVESEYTCALAGERIMVHDYVTWIDTETVVPVYREPASHIQGIAKTHAERGELVKILVKGMVDYR